MKNKDESGRGKKEEVGCGVVAEMRIKASLRDGERAGGGNYLSWPLIYELWGHVQAENAELTYILHTHDLHPSAGQSC